MTKHIFSNFIRTIQLACFVIATLIFTQSSYASKDLHGDDLGKHHKTHYFGMFVGTLDADETSSMMGFEYEYRFNKNWGIGALYEDAKDAHKGDGVSSAIAAVYYHPYAGWRIALGMGQEKVGGSNPFTEKLIRVGLAYKFQVGGIGVEPSFNIDTINGKKSSVYGVAFVLAR